MNRSALLIGLGGGVVSAILLLSAAQGSFAGLILLFLLGPLPLFLAGLGWGTAAAAIAASTGAGAAGVMLGPYQGLSYLLTQGVPAVMITYLALARYETARLTDAANADTWFPVGHLVTTIALLAGVIAAGLLTLIIANLGWEIDDLRSSLRTFIEHSIRRQVPGIDVSKLTPEDIADLTNLVVARTPFAMALTWFAVFGLNLWMAGRVSLASGRLERPWPNLTLVQLPAWHALVLSVTLALTYVPGLIGYLAIVLSTACLAGYALQGLAIVHRITHGHTWRGFLLFATYLVLFISGVYGFYAIALIGLAEPISPLNRDKWPRGG